MDEWTAERYGSVPWRERYGRPGIVAVNRWGDTAEDQRWRRAELLEATDECRVAHPSDGIAA